MGFLIIYHSFLSQEPPLQSQLRLLLQLGHIYLIHQIDLVGLCRRQGMEAVLAVVGMGVLQLEDKVLDLLGVDRQAVDLEEGKQAVGLEEADRQDKALDLLGDMGAVGLDSKEADLHHIQVHL